MRRPVLALVGLLLAMKLSSQPTIFSFSPTSGPVGTVVTIKGTQFDLLTSNNVVYFGAVKTSVSSATDTSLVVTVPIGATYQSISVTTNNLTAYSSQPFDVTFNGAVGPFSSNFFLPKIAIASRKYPYAVANGDFDGDGKADLLVPIGGADTVSLYPNVGSPGSILLGEAVNIITKGNDNEECVVGDLDGDGKLDFIVTNGAGSVTVPTGSYSFSVFRNTSSIGSISFARTDYPTSTACFFATINDLNGDGKPDIAVANRGYNTISVFINASTPGNISFNPKVDFLTNSQPYFITAGDLDGDQKPDLVVMTGAGSGSTMSVLRNTTANGNVSFAPNVNLTFVNSPYFSIIGDLDGDGKPDITATNANAVAVLRNISTQGNISFASVQNFATGILATCIGLTDLNGDGKADLAVSNGGSNTVSALRNTSTTGNISFDAHVDYAVGNSPFSIACADLDGDNRPDIVSANSNDSTISILRNVVSLGTPPSISSFTPTSGVAGTQVKILGSNFTNATSVKFGGVAAASFAVDSATGITAIVADGATGNVEVTTDFGTAALPGFTYNGPVITSFNPASGISGTVVTITGANFTGATAVKFGGAPASSFIVNSSTVITATVGAGASGNVTVTSPNGTGSLAGFSYNLPIITSFTPASGAVGTSVVISGQHFDPIPSNNIVYFGAVKAAVSASTDSTIFVTVPAGATYQPLTVTVSNVTGYSNKPFTVTFGGGGSPFISTSFIPKVDFDCGNNPHSVATGDFDGDGKIDILVPKGNSNTVSVFKNTSSVGSISFASKLELLAPGSQHEGSAVGDIDGDGKLDFVVVNGTTYYTVSVFRNTTTAGNMSFDSKIDYLTGNSPYSAALSDLNGDGRPELIVANNGADTISVYKNLSSPGSISFATKLDFYSGTHPYGISAGDLDGDGKPDLVFTTQGANSALSILRNTSASGDISFAPKIDLTTLAGPFLVSIGDLDADDKPDLAAVNSNSNTVAVLRNKSTPGNISFGRTPDFATGNYPVCVSIADLNGDGKPDLATSNRFSNDVSLLRNISTPGNISFETHVDYPVNTDPLFAAVGDLDGDGRPDLISANSATNVISVLKNIIGANVAPTITSFTPTFGLAGTVVKITGTNFTGTTTVAFGAIPASSFTVDSSTSITAVVASGATGNVSVTTSYGTVTLSGFVYGLAPIITSFTPISGPIGTMVTISGSRFDPIASQNIVYFGPVRANVSSGTDSTLLVTVPLGATYQPITVTSKNLTAYSDKPFTVTFTAGDSVFKSYSFSPKIDFGSGIYPHSVASGDFDGDGKSDLLVSRGSSGGVVTIFKNSSSKGIISFSSKLDFAAAGSNEGAAIGDFDGDGELDFVITGGSNLVSVHRNISTIGNISFASKITYPSSAAPYSVAIADLNHDGRPDLVVANDGDSVVSIYRNISTPGNILFDNKVDWYSGPNPYGVSIGDLDGDGKPDLAIMTQGYSRSLSVMRNTGTDGNISFAPIINILIQIDPQILDRTFIAAIGDVDGDGKPDITATASNSLRVLRNLSTPGNISFSLPQDFAAGNYVTSVSLGDLDGDGKPDAVTSNTLDNTVSVLKNTSAVGNISFDGHVDYSVDQHPIYVAISDFDNDGRPDIAVANSSSDSVSILRNTIGEPHITSVSGLIGGDSTNITITGRNFLEADSVEFGGTLARSFSVESSVEINAVVGGGASGNITVTSPKGRGTLAGFTFIPKIGADGPINFCSGGSVTLTSTAIENNQWYKNASAISGALAKTLVVNSSGTYSVKTTSNGITTASDDIAIAVTTVPTPVITLDASNNLVSSATTGNQWYLDGNLIAGANGQTYHPTQSGSYTVRDTLNNCVSDFAAAYSFVVTGIINLGNRQYIRIYPNPVKNSLNVEWNIIGSPALNVDITDLQGRRMLSFKNIRNATTIDLSRFPQSIYIIKIYSDRLKINYTLEIVKQN